MGYLGRPEFVPTFVPGGVGLRPSVLSRVHAWLYVLWLLASAWASGPAPQPREPARSCLLQRRVLSLSHLHIPPRGCEPLECGKGFLGLELSTSNAPSLISVTAIQNSSSALWDWHFRSCYHWQCEGPKARTRSSSPCRPLRSDKKRLPAPYC